MKNFLIVWSLIAIIVLGASFVADARYRGEAKLVQRIKKDPSAALFGDEGTPVGSPQLMIIADSKAFSGRTVDGAYIVDEAYLEAQNIYPLQLQTVLYVSSLVKWASGFALLLGALVYIVVARRKQSLAPNGA